MTMPRLRIGSSAPAICSPKSRPMRRRPTPINPRLMRLRPLDRPEAAIENRYQAEIAAGSGATGSVLVRQLPNLEAAEDLLAGSRDRRKSASILISKSYIHSTSGDLTEAADEARRAAQLTRKGEQPDFEARLALGQSLSLSGAWQENAQYSSAYSGFLGRTPS